MKLLSNSEQHLVKLKETITTVNECLRKRLDMSANAADGLFMNMRWVDPANWGNVDEEIQMMLSVAEHFKVTLQHAKFNFDQRALKQEWKRLKDLVQLFYRRWKAKKLWQQILEYRREEFPNVCLLVEIIFCIGPSNTIVEKCFSQLTAMLSDRRCNLGPTTMEDLLLIQTNHLSWTPDERDELIDCALVKYMSKRRKLKLDNASFNMIGVSDRKRT